MNKFYFSRKFPILLYFFIVTFIKSQSIPGRYFLNEVFNDSLVDEGLSSNVVAEIRLLGDSLTWFGTGRGLAVHDGTRVFTYKSSSDSLADGEEIVFLPNGGIPAIAVYGDTMVVAFSGDDGDIQMGLGLAVTFSAQDTNGIAWKFFDQPMDSDLDSIDLIGGVGQFRKLPVTVPQANVTYDLSVTKDYFWTASWAGGLRNYNFSRNEWRHIPLPLDSQLDLDLCNPALYDSTGGPFILKDYYLNPRDPIDNGNHNHKAFSVLAYGDTVWVGTANGINRGLIVRDTLFGDNSIECIRWRHYSYPEHGLSGNFVVGLAKQYWMGQITIWAATVNADSPGEERGLSYTRDGGETWETALIGERIYNITSKDSLVLVSSKSGLWKSIDGINWAKFDAPVDRVMLSQKQIISDVVYTAAIDSRGVSNRIWLGSPDGVGLSSDIHGSDWSIFQADFDTEEIYAYPNPFSPRIHNQMQGDGFVRFHTGTITSEKLDLNIYNFAMEKVHKENYDLEGYRGAIKWNGRGQDGNHVANGVYFASLNYSSTKNKTMSLRWTKFILVK
tara:strand:- start:6485 stop:8155 length:1671 start_codon:yes stop_codon:yes gene_type:complete